jgi:phage shock protein PspC (stress-responsive transcriptional regulator)
VKLATINRAPSIWEKKGELIQMKKMTKSKDNKVLTGTLAGIAEYFGIDPTIARVVFVLSIFLLEGSPIILYLLFAFFIPSADNSERASYKKAYTRPAESQPKQVDAVADDTWSDF